MLWRFNPLNARCFTTSCLFCGLIFFQFLIFYVEFFKKVYEFSLTDDYKDKEVKQKLVEAFESVSKGFVEDLINGPLMEKMSLEDQFPEVKCFFKTKYQI